ncbi:hypothetical protein RHMOL_Rhmol06G0014600 [Rhododendron molle]|uniref:Uncharacterized protein n=5 Tax=Rhododendron molle TaxID=49168 RepID=A0ACC0M3Y3_RHOML|nr:hypothetical protein RHMOL_Rhmol10G0192200 [Rhododendron molle]KAI8535675.1 hypothetical protein RHMOL_Rhmol10G0192200 [Rhododendron molle]KAI8535676.1 hypothetical protein RHMOL_Rhmol10G0192200 [Rhododendron molle]KAI8549294.1 hypothetical protein RHMOL_Rhmol06G0014600 [Rhododendron molle]KAI8549295.1 hypothetical protein RHMOL_Rhmol06G0014600 [Rhododendron molle]
MASSAYDLTAKSSLADSTRGEFGVLLHILQLIAVVFNLEVREGFFARSLRKQDWEGILVMRKCLVFLRVHLHQGFAEMTYEEEGKFDVKRRTNY